MTNKKQNFIFSSVKWTNEKKKKINDISESTFENDNE